MFDIIAGANNVKPHHAGYKLEVRVSACEMSEGDTTGNQHRGPCHRTNQRMFELQYGRRQMLMHSLTETWSERQH